MQAREGGFHLSVRIVKAEVAQEYVNSIRQFDGCQAG